MLRFLLVIGLFSSVATYAQNQDSLSVYFETGSSHLAPAALEQLKKVKRRIKMSDACTLHLEGFTDDVGSTESNLVLSQARVESVRKALNKYQADLSWECTGQGELPLPEPTSDVPNARKSNRRVDIHYTCSVHIEEIVVSPVVEAKTDDVSTLLAEAKVGEKVTLNNILFAGGTSEILQPSYQSARDLRDYLLSNTNVEIKIIGHICCHANDGTDGTDANTGLDNLSEARAARIESWLIDQGVEASRLSIEGKMASEPLGGDRRLDRRVEVEITSN